MSNDKEYDICDQVINQHYVWRNYLSPWTKEGTSKGHIYCLFIKEQKIAFPKLKTIAKDDYFYEIKPLSDDEICLIQSIIDEVPKESVIKESCQTLLNNYITSQQIGIFNGINEKYDRELLNYKKCIVEKYYKNIESMGIKFLNNLKEKNIDFYDNNEELFNFYLFIANQFTRSKALKERLKKQFYNNKTRQYRIENCFVPIATITAIIMAYNMLQRQVKIKFLENKTNISFITGESPIINIKAYYISGKESDEVELYYPITSKTAILITEYEHSDITEIMESEEIEKYNYMIYKSTHTQLYSCDEASLIKYK